MNLNISNTHFFMCDQNSGTDSSTIVGTTIVDISGKGIKY